jgi:hypothetical protein
MWRYRRGDAQTDIVIYGFDCKCKKYRVTNRIGEIYCWKCGKRSSDTDGVPFFTERIMKLGRPRQGRKNRGHHGIHTNNPNDQTLKVHYVYSDDDDDDDAKNVNHVMMAQTLAMCHKFLQVLLLPCWQSASWDVPITCLYTHPKQIYQRRHSWSTETVMAIMTRTLGTRINIQSFVYYLLMSWETLWPRELVALSLSVRITSGLMWLVTKAASKGHWHSNSWYSSRHESTLGVWLMIFDRWQHAGGRNGPLQVGISAWLVGADNVPDLVGDEGSRISKDTPGITDLRNCLFVCIWRDSSNWTTPSSFTRFLDHTQRRTTISRTPLD